MILIKLAKAWSKVTELNNVSLDGVIKDYSDTLLKSLKEERTELEQERRELVNMTAEVGLRLSKIDCIVNDMEKLAEPVIIKMTTEEVQKRVNITRLLQERNNLNHALTGVRTNLQLAIAANNEERIESLTCSEITVTVKLEINADKLKALGVTHHQGEEL